MKKITFLKSLFVAFLLSCTTLLSAADYVKVTTAPSDWSGTYLIVCEDGNVALTDAVDAANNGTAVTIVDGKITTDANIAFTIAAINGGYSIKAPNEKYIGSTTNNNELETGTTAYTNAISLENDGSVKIVGTSSVLRYNASKDQLRFRYFKAASYTNQKSIQLYKLASEGEGGGDVVDPDPEPDPEEPTPDPEEPGSGFIGEYTHTFASGELSNGSVTLSDVVWNFAMETSTYFGWDSNSGRGIQMGSGNNPAPSIVLSSSAFAGKVTKVVVNTSGASDVKADLSVAVGGVLLSPENARLTTTATDYTFTGEASGEIVITWTNQSKKAIYIKSLSVVTEAGTVEAPTVVKPLFSVASKKFTEAFELTLSCATEGAEIYYTFEEAGEFVKYTEPLNITETTTVYAKAVLGEEESEVASVTYTYVNPVVTIAEFLAAEVNDGILYELTGVVSNIVNTTYGNFDLVDETGTVYVYGLKANATAGNQTFGEIEGLEEGDTLTLRGYRAAYNGKAQVGSAYYVSHIDAAQIVELPEVENIAALVELNQKARITNAVTVVAQTGKYLWIKDASMSMLVYGEAPATYTNGDQLTGLVATVTTYAGATQLTPVEFPEAVAGTPVEPTVMALADVTANTVHQYIRLENVTYTNVETLTAGETTLAMFDRFEYTYAGAEGDIVDVIAIAGLYNGTVQVYPISIEEVVAPVVPAKPVIEIDAVKATATITCETERATVKYAMLKQGEEVTEEAYQEIGEAVELNKVEGDYVIYAYAVIGDVKSEVAEATYTYKNGQVAVDAEMVTITDVYVQNNTIVAEGEFQIFTVTGQNVTDINGSLTRGAYIVRTAEGVAKVIVR